MNGRSHQQQMSSASRRKFLEDVGRGMLVAGVGSTLAFELGLCPAAAADFDDLVRFGELEPLVQFMQQTPLEKLQREVVSKLKQGTDSKSLVAAAALANARAFGGQDYDGYHTFMALIPAWEMSHALPESERPLPILKVLYRNTARMQSSGALDHEALHLVEAADLPAGADPAISLQSAVRTGESDKAEAVFAAIAQGPVGEAYNHLQYSVQDEVDVHRIVLAWRAWSMLSVAGEQHAHTLLRQSVRYCVAGERSLQKNGRAPSEIRKLLPQLLSDHGLLERPLGTRDPGDAWVESTAQLIFGGTRPQAAAAVAQALAEGISPDAIGEAISLASNQLLLCDPGRSASQASPGKPAGSVHGASVGVHASDSANAWRNIAKVSNPRNTAASLIVGAFHTAGQAIDVGSTLMAYREASAELSDRTETLLTQLDEAVRAGEQLRAAAVVARWEGLGQSPDPLFKLLLRFGVSEDGALHAEKYYRTVAEEFSTTRPAFRWRHLVGLARVTASESGHPAPGQEEARQLLRV